MKVIDLTHTIREKMPVYPGTDTPKFIPANSYEKDGFNIENLKNLDLCGSDVFWFSCFPLKLEDCDGSPIRAVAWFD